MSSPTPPPSTAVPPHRTVRLRRFTLVGLSVNVLAAFGIGWTSASTPGAALMVLLPLMLTVPPVGLAAAAWANDSVRHAGPARFFAGLLAALTLPYAVTVAAGEAGQVVGCAAADGPTTPVCE